MTNRDKPTLRAEKEGKMPVVYGISRWTNSSRPSARHIDNGNGRPLCQSKRKVLSWQSDVDVPTCKVCMRRRNETK